MPAQAAVRDHVITQETTVLDYGCGRGDDIRNLINLGIPAQGWDPHYRPHPPPKPADVILLTYVLNVIDDLKERERTLRAALKLARKCIVASTRLRWDDVSGLDYGDGVLTSRGTFQALHRPREFRLWTHMVTGIRPHSGGPETVYLFTDPAARTAHVHRAYAAADQEPATDPEATALQQLVNHLNR